MKLNKLSLNTVGLNRIGLNRIGLPSYGSSSGSARPYIDPELLSHVKMAISTWGKTNDDPDRAVLKDLSGNGNDMRLLNFGFAGGSGYGKYKEDFTTWVPQYNIADSTHTSNKLHITKVKLPNAILYTRKAVKSMKVEVKGSRNIELYYRYSSEENVSKLLMLDREGIYELPDSLDFNYTGFEIHNYVGDCDITITQIPDFEGWLCTDGVDDIIVSEKTVGEMIGDSKECTVLSIYHTINKNTEIGGVVSNSLYYDSHIYNITQSDDCICGYSVSLDNSNVQVINNILGDKNKISIDHQFSSDDISILLHSKFNVFGINNGGIAMGISSNAYAGGFIANKVLATNEINQIIAYFNLDRPGQIIKPQLYCNIKKQGITNDNHAEFNDQLIDFVGGHNIQLNNVAWEGGSGIIEGALFLDGISDFGKATGLPILKDYTVVADRKLYNGKHTGAVVSKAYAINNGSFYLESAVSVASFGALNELTIRESRFMSYQSKYIYNGNPIQVGTGVDSDSMWLGTIRDGDSRFSKLALSLLMLFSYSLSEFLLERQLRKYNAGTLYPGMVEFRPIVKSNVPYSSISYSVNPGVYVTEGSTVTITITLSNASDKLVGVSSSAIADISISGDNGVYEITGKVTKSPQKINITINENI